MNKNEQDKAPQVDNDTIIDGDLPEGLIGDIDLEGAEAAPEGADVGRIAELEAEVAQYKERFMRAHADMENTRRRAEQEIANKSRFAVQEFAKSLLSVADNLDRALMAVPAEARENDEPTKNLIVGVELTRGEMVSVFERFGVKSVEAEGHIFDPNLHQAMMEMENPDVPHGTVVQVMQEGYTLNGRLLRPAMVAIAKGGPKPGQTDAEAGANVDETA